MVSICTRKLRVGSAEERHGRLLRWKAAFFESISLDIDGILLLRKPSSWSERSVSLKALRGHVLYRSARVVVDAWPDQRVGQGHLAENQRRGTCRFLSDIDATPSSDAMSSQSFLPPNHYIEDLRDHLRKCPNDRNFRVLPDPPGRGCEWSPVIDILMSTLMIS